MAVDMFLKIDGIEGESTDGKHSNEIDVLSFSWGATNPGLAVGQPAARHAKVNVSDLTFVKRVDKATPLLLQQAATGQPFPRATLTVRKAGQDQQEYIKITMSDIIVTTVSGGGISQSDELPSEQISLNFAKVDFSVLASSDSFSK